VPPAKNSLPLNWGIAAPPIFVEGMRFSSPLESSPFWVPSRSVECDADGLFDTDAFIVHSHLCANPVSTSGAQHTVHGIMLISGGGCGSDTGGE
jgi:hypothetical protein